MSNYNKFMYETTFTPKEQEEILTAIKKRYTNKLYRTTIVSFGVGIVISYMSYKYYT